MTRRTSITIVTPSYDQGQYIERTINSVLNQDIYDIEYLIFDGNSRDETVDILKTFGSRIEWVSERDNGQADAVNKGLLKASGDIIGWLNSDDIYYPGTLKRVLDIFDSSPTVDVIYGEADHIDEQDRVFEPYYTEEWNYDRLKDVCFICQPAVFFRKSVVDKYGVLDSKLQYCMDYEYWLRIGKDKPFYFLREKLAGSRLYMENKTLGNRQAVHKEIISMIKKRLGIVPAKWIYNLAHVIAEESGLSRETPQSDLEFVKKVVRTSCWLFVKNRHYIPLQELRKMQGWLSDASKACRG